MVGFGSRAPCVRLRVRVRSLSTQAAPDGLVIAPGAVLVGKYRVVRSIGRGGMAQVYEALQMGLGKRVAVKVLNAQYAGSPILTERFFREARAASAVKSPYIVDVYDSGRLDDQRPFIVMELLEGESLYERLSRVRRLTPQQVLALVANCAKGLAKAHAAGIVHRDLKPENVFLVRAEEGPEVAKLLDFGLAKFYAATDEDEAVQRLTRDGAVFGTPPYMSPEQVRGQVGVDHRSDMWALGCIVYEALVGKPVWRTDQGVAMIFASIASGELPHPSVENHDLPDSFDRWFRKALARKSDDRFQSAMDFAESLQEAFSPEAIGRVRAEVQAAADERRFHSLRPPPMPLPPPPPLELRTKSMQTAATEAVEAPLRPRLSEPPPFAVQNRRHTWAVRIGIGALLVGVFGVGVGLALGTSPDAAPSAPSPTINATPAPAEPVAERPAPSFATMSVSDDARAAVRARHFGEAADLVKSATAGEARWLAEAWRRVVPADVASCAPTGWAAVPGDALAVLGTKGSRVFALTGSRGAQHVVSYAANDEGWFEASSVADATPEGGRFLGARVVPVGERFALFVVEAGDDDKSVRVRVRSLGENGSPLGSAVNVLTIQGFRHLSEVALLDDGYALAFGSVTPAGVESISVLRVERSFEARGRATSIAQAGARAGTTFGPPHLSAKGKDVLVAYVVASGGHRFAETQLFAASAPLWGTDGFTTPVDAKGSRRVGPAPRVAERVAPAGDVDLACRSQNCVLAWEDDVRGTYVARLDSTSGGLQLATALGKGVGRTVLAPVSGSLDDVHVLSVQGGALRSTLVDARGAHPGVVLVRTSGSVVAADASTAGLRVLVEEGDAAQRHGLFITTSCR